MPLHTFPPSRSHLESCEPLHVPVPECVDGAARLSLPLVTALLSVLPARPSLPSLSSGIATSTLPSLFSPLMARSLRSSRYVIGQSAFLLPSLHALIKVDCCLIVSIALFYY